LNKFQPNNVLFLENSWIGQNSLEKNIMELWVNESINLPANNINRRYKTHTEPGDF
jgi:hypothetical protein